MKKLSLLFLAGMISLGLAAQTDAGTMYLGSTLDGSNFGYISSKTGDADAEGTMALNIDYGYFVMDNLMITAGLKYSKVGDADAKTGFGVGARYYINGSIMPFVKYMIGPEKNLDEDNHSDLDIGCGYAVFLSDNIVLEPGLMYRIGMGRQVQSTTPTGGLTNKDVSHSAFGLVVGLGIHL